MSHIHSQDPKSVQGDIEMGYRERVSERKRGLGGLGGLGGLEWMGHWQGEYGDLEWGYSGRRVPPK
jgi:hypothetical protein